jgi:hypothetical protein
MVETAKERMIFLKDFGQTVKIRPVSGQKKTVTAIFDNDYIEVDTGGNVGFALLQPRLMCKTSDVAAVTEDATVEIDTVHYKVKVVKPDGTGMTELILEKQ